MLYLQPQDKKIDANLFNRLHHSSTDILLYKFWVFVECGLGQIIRWVKEIKN